jgi:hypothetical protein
VKVVRQANGRPLVLTRRLPCRVLLPPDPDAQQSISRVAVLSLFRSVGKFRKSRLCRQHIVVSFFLAF